MVTQEEYSRLREKAVNNGNHIMISDESCKPIFMREPRTGFHSHGQLVFEDPECTVRLMCRKHPLFQMFMLYASKYASPICPECLMIDYKSQEWVYLDAMEFFNGMKGE